MTFFRSQTSRTDIFPGEALYESEVSFEHLYQFYEGKDWMCDRIEKLEEDLKILAGMPPFAAINYIRCGIGYNEYIREYAGYRKMKPEELNDVMDELQQSARKYRTFEEWCTYIQDYTLELRKQKSKKQEGGITISTLHGAKGLEYPHVYIMDINEERYLTTKLCSRKRLKKSEGFCMWG